MKTKKLLRVLPEWFKRFHSFLKIVKTPTKLIYILISVLASIWFLVRVIPKPSRATYPCMQVAAPFMSALVIWLISVFASWFGIKKIKELFRKAKYINALFYVLIVSVAFILLLSSNPRQLLAADEPWFSSNIPIGEGKGIFPGRVVWAHNPEVTNFSGSGSYYTDESINQDEADIMVNDAVQTLTGESGKASAWDALFKHFNNSKRNLNAGYTFGEKICIKVNFNSTHSGQGNTNQINTSPQMIMSILRGLINDAGVSQTDITVSDPSRYFMDYCFNKLNNEFPDVHYEDHGGANGRDAVSYTDNAIMYSIDNDDQNTGLANSHIDATYLINMAVLKGHTGNAVTFCGKNWFGSTDISNDFSQNHHNNFGPSRDGKSKYMTFTDFMGHKDLGEKTFLFMIEGIFGMETNWGVPNHLWQMSPFNNDWPSSLFISQDGVAIDAVAMDFYSGEFPEGPGVENFKMIYADMYLNEAALIGNAPSGTTYDPEKDETILSGSLGVLEHWNNAEDKQYSRNINSSAEGIELVYTFLGVEPVISYLDITSGSGSGEYQERTFVDIIANAAPEGQTFDKWLINSGNPSITNIYAPTTRLVMPLNPAAVTATYTSIEECVLPYSIPDLAYTQTKESVLWSSDPINISCDSNVEISIDIEAVVAGEFEKEDYLKISCILDGIEEVISEKSDDFPAQTISKSIKGDIVRIIIEAKNSAGNETYNVTNILIESVYSSVINSAEKEQVVSVYPNPARSYAIINYEMPSNENDAEIQIYNINGKLISAYQIDKTVDKLRISTDELSTGTYIVNLKTKKGISEGEKLIIH